MILKKPYAFLIKYFRIIHLILAIPLVYLVTKSLAIVNFFNDYVKNDYSLTINGDLSTIFVNPLMYISVIFVLMSAIAVYLLFKYKEKPTKHYIAIIIYYLILFILFTICVRVLDVMETDVIEASIARTYRDSSLLLVLPQFYFCGFIILRGLGFNIKKLNFASDSKELEISDKDSEEFEFIVGIEGYKAKRTFRRFIREFSYYIKENTFIFITIVLVLIIGTSTAVYLNKEEYEKTYKIGATFAYNNFTISVEDSIKTNLAYNGSIINKDKYYLIIKLKVKNNLSKSASLDYTNFRIKIDQEFLYPIIDKASYFADYATPYNGGDIPALEENTYVLVYEIPKEKMKDNYELKIYNGINQKDGQINTKYLNVSLNPLLIDEKIEVKSVNLKEQLDLTNSNIGDTELTINDYKITDKYVYKYEKCYSNKCYNYTDYVAIDYLSVGSGSTLLAMDYNLVLDTISAYSNYIKSEKTFFDNFLTIRYQLDEQTYTTTVLNRTPNNLQNKLILQVSDRIKQATQIEVLITVRNKVYSITLLK